MAYSKTTHAIGLLGLSSLFVLGAGCVPATSDSLDDTNTEVNEEAANTGDAFDDVVTVENTGDDVGDAHPQAEQVLANLAGNWNLTHQVVTAGGVDNTSGLLGATLSVTADQYSLTWAEGYYEPSSCEDRYTAIGFPSDSPITLKDLCAYECSFPSGIAEQGTIRVLSRESLTSPGTYQEILVFEPDVESQAVAAPDCTTGGGVAATSIEANFLVLGGQYAWELHPDDLVTPLSVAPSPTISLILENGATGFDRQVVEFSQL